MLDDGGGEEVSVRADDVAGWHRSAEELWRAARENLAGEWDRAQRDVQSLDGGDVRIITGPSPFVSSLLLRLDDIGDLLPSGALVAVPHRQVLLATPLESESAAARVTPEMEALAEGLYAPGRAAISPGVFWWRFGAPLERASTVVAPRYTS